MTSIEAIAAAREDIQREAQLNWQYAREALCCGRITQAQFDSVEAAADGSGDMQSDASARTVLNVL